MDGRPDEDLYDLTALLARGCAPDECDPNTEDGECNPESCQPMHQCIPDWKDPCAPEAPCSPDQEACSPDCDK